MPEEKGPHLRLRYRPDVDGLRAVAVLLVLARHLVTKAMGGYVGVDVFFVISGYLIGASIFSDMAAGRFSIVGFYERRVRRIFPAMLVMMLGTTVLAYRYLVPSEVESYAKSLLAALASGSNFFFWRDGGYFDLPTYLKPLLHTWSLGVEEQFYVLFPVFLMFLARWFPGRLKAAIVGVMLVSFAAACIAVRWSPVTAFFFAPLRAWELLLGTIVSQGYVPRLHTAGSRDAASVAGLLLILVPSFLYGESTSFPGLAAVPPCLGAALIIAAGETGPSIVGRILTWRPIVFIGLISYSLYLWHWPIIVFQGAGEMVLHTAILTRTGKLVLAVVSIAVAALSWRFVEQPFRRGRLKPGRRGVLAINGVAALVLAGLGAGMLLARGMPGRFPAQAQRVLAAVDEQSRLAGDDRDCFLTPSISFADFPKDRCTPPEAGGGSILLVGDSHAHMMWPGLAAVFVGRPLLEASASDCAPLVESARADSINCRRLLDYVFEDYLLHHRVGTVLLVARWRASDLQALGKTIEYARFHGVRVAVVGPNIQYDSPEPRVIALALRDGLPDEIRKHEETAPQALDREMVALAGSRWHVPYISVFEDLCRPGCPVYAEGGAPLLSDGNHLTVSGAILLAKVMRERGQLP